MQVFLVFVSVDGNAYTRAVQNLIEFALCYIGIALLSTYIDWFLFDSLFIYFRLP